MVDCVPRAPSMHKKHSFQHIRAVCITNRVPGGVDPESLDISAQDTSSDIFIWAFLRCRSLFEVFLSDFLSGDHLQKYRFLICWLYTQWIGFVWWLDLDSLIILAWDVPCDISFWAFLAFPWPVEVFLSDDHLPKYNVCKISIAYITYRDAGGPDSEARSIFTLDACSDIVIWAFLRYSSRYSVSCWCWWW